MLTLSFRCPQCSMHCIWGTRCNDAGLSLASGLPVRIRCAACGHENLVFHQDRGNDPLLGQHGSYVELCVKIAGFCSHRAATVLFPVVQTLFLANGDRLA